MTETTTPAPTPAAPQTTVELVREKLAAASTPLKFGDVSKGIPKPKKPAVLQEEVKAALEEEIRAGRAFAYPSGKKDELRYWARDEKQMIRDETVQAAQEPLPIVALVKKAKQGVNAEAGFAEAVVRELIAEERLFEHPPKKGVPLFGSSKYRSPNDKPTVSTALLDSATTPQKLTDLVKVATTATKADKPFVETVANELIAEKRLFEHPPKKGVPLFGSSAYRSPNDKPTVSAALLDIAARPQAVADLVKAAMAVTKADKAFVETLAKELIESAQLHEYPGKGKNRPYGQLPPPPPDPLEGGPGKKAFAAFVKAARTVAAVPGVSIDDLLTRLREALAEPAPVPPPPQIVPTPPLVPAELTPEQIRIGLKAAYDELCLDVDFQDRLVEVPRLYHEAVKLLPGLTVDQFHRELEELQHSRTLELQTLNEVQRAKEPHLAIHRGDRLLYFVIWK